MKNLSTVQDASKVHRLFVPRIIYLDATPQEQLSLFVFHPSQTSFLYPETSLWGIFDFRKKSPIDVYNPNLEDFPDFDKVEYTEIPLIGGQAVTLPQGWWLFVDDTTKIIEKIFL
jgi:hypothetical protein